MKDDAKIEDVVPTLSNPIEYLRGIVGSFVEHGFDRGKSIVRIGVTGRGIVPNYSIETPCEQQLGPLHSSVSERKVFNGSSHNEILDDSPYGDGWSSRSSTFDEVQDLLGKVRGFKSTKI